MSITVKDLLSKGTVVTKNKNSKYSFGSVSKTIKTKFFTEPQTWDQVTEFIYSIANTADKQKLNEVSPKAAKAKKPHNKLWNSINWVKYNGLLDGTIDMRELDGKVYYFGVTKKQ